MDRTLYILEDRKMRFSWGERSLTLSSFPDRMAINKGR
jgi:hypothetical protein